MISPVRVILWSKPDCQPCKLLAPLVEDLCTRARIPYRLLDATSDSDRRSYGDERFADLDVQAAPSVLVELIDARTNVYEPFGHLITGVRVSDVKAKAEEVRLLIAKALAQYNTPPPPAAARGRAVFGQPLSGRPRTR